MKELSGQLNIGGNFATQKNSPTVGQTFCLNPHFAGIVQPFELECSLHLGSSNWIESTERRPLQQRHYMSIQLQMNTGEKGYKKILVATDGSPFGEAAVKAAADRGWPKDAQLRIVTVAETPVIHGSVMLLSRLADMESSAIQEIALKAAGELQRGSENVSTVVRKGSPADEIIKEAKDWGADLIILGTHGRSGADLFLLGSVAERVAAYASCSVEIVRRN